MHEHFTSWFSRKYALKIFIFCDGQKNLTSEMIESVVNKNSQRLVDEPRRIFPAAHKVPMTSF